MTLAEDTILEDRYRIDRLLRQQGRRATYRGFDLNLNMPVIIKENSLQTIPQINQFKQEALILTGLRHQSLPWVIHHFSLNQHQYLVLNDVEGQSLWEIIQVEGPLSEPKALRAMTQVCQGVNHLHQQSPPIIHNDITPHNIKLTGNSQAILLGFGIAKQGDQPPPVDPELPQAGYIAPERFSGRRVTPVSDVYALGATLYALVTGIEPPNSLSATKLKSPQSINPDLNDLTVKAINQAMQPRPADRPPSVSVWLKELEYVQKSTGSPPMKPAVAAVASPRDTLDLNPKLSKSTKFWLVNPTGLGYAVGPKPLVIGRSPESDIVVEDKSVSLSHTYVRTDDSHCLVMDIDSANGTFLNNQRLMSGWYPFNAGDILVVGPTRFHLTNIQPVRQASVKPRRAISIGRSHLKTAVVTPSQADATPHQKKRWGPILLLLLILLLLGGGGAAYLLLNPDAPLAELIAVSSTSPDEAPDDPQEQADLPTAPSEETTVEPIAQLQSSATEPPTDSTATAGPTSAEPTAENTTTTSEEALAASVQLTGTRVTTATAPPTETLDSAPSSTLTGTPNSTTTVQAATPTPAGPTLIPVESQESIDQIGAREVIDIDINPQNPREVYALVKGDGIYKSSNGGDAPWVKLPLDAAGVAAFVIDPTNPARFYAPTWNAVLKSSDGGNSWAAHSNGLEGNQTVNVVTVDPVDPSVLYAGVGETLVVSTDGGQNWRSLGYGEGLGVGKLYSIVVDPFNHSTVYVAGLAGSIYKSVDSANTFTQLPDNVGQGAYSFVAHPTRPDVYLAGINSANAAILKTENGLNFNNISAGLVFGGSDSPYNALAISPSNPNIIYAGTGDEDNRLAKGIFKSTNGGETWVSISEDLPRNPDTGQPYYVKTLAVHPTNPDLVFAATGRGLYQSVDGGQNWELR